MPSSLSPSLLAILLPILSLLTYIIRRSLGRRRYRLPPGPSPLPIIGNLHILSSHPHRDVAKLSKIYGPILHLRLGSVPTIFVSSPSIAEQVLKDHDVVFANRPRSEAAKFLSYGNKGLAFTEYGPYWRQVRKLCVTHYFALAKVELYEFVRREEIGEFVKELKEAAEARDLVDVTSMVRSLSADMVCRTVIGKKCLDGSRFISHIDKVMRILGSFDLNDFFRILRLFDLGGMRRRTRAVKRPLDKYLEKIIDEHLRVREEGKRPKPRDFVDIMLDCMNDEASELELDRASIKAIILDIFEGTMDTAPVAIEWALVELLRHPKVMKKVQEELATVVGMHRAVEESDLSKLPYLAMVVKESLRLHHLGPFLLHRTKQDFVLEGYDVPNGSNVLVCSWAMGRDPNLWPDPENFVPERFKNSCIDVKGHNYNLLPFGSGRRGCPAMSYSMLVIPLVVAQMVHCFDWKLPNGMSPSDLDTREKFGLTMPRVVHLHATPIYRLCRIV